jgi:hypothetical protein
MNLCETSAPLASSYRPSPLVPSVQVFPVPADVVSQHLQTLGSADSKAVEDFTPLGEWVGSYTCAQGYTGGSLQIHHVQGKDFEGVFKFFATPRNPSVPAGSYNVYGQYDKASARILINPGSWIQRPTNYYNTVMVGSFDRQHDTFSAFFQGISGCTSFEAKRAGEPYVDTGSKKPKKHAVKKKKPVKKKSAAVAPVTSAPVTTIVPAPTVAVPAATEAPTPVSSSVPAPSTVPVYTAPSVPVLPAGTAQDGITLSAPNGGK